MAPVAVLLSSTHCFRCSNAVWPYGYSSTERTGMPASGTPEPQWGTRSSPPTRLCAQTVAYPADSRRHLCLISANRTPCRRNQWAGLQSHTHGLLLPKESAHPGWSPSQCNRTCSYKPTATAHASERTTLPYRGPQHSWHKLPVQDLGWTLRWQTWSLSRDWTLASLHQCGWASNHGQPTASNTSDCNACICWPIACALQPWCLCTEPLLNIQLSRQLWLKEHTLASLHQCCRASDHR